MYFRLNSECYYVKGKTCGALYDLVTGNLYSFNSVESAILDMCEKNNPVTETDPFLHDLSVNGLGEFYDSKPYIEKIRMGSPIENYQPGRPPQVNRAVIEINNGCDRSCSFCGSREQIRGMGCLGCNTWNEEGSPVPVTRWKHLVDELADLDCNSLTVTGGDLSRVYDNLNEIIRYASGKIPRLFITLNENNVDLDMMQDLFTLAKPIVQITEIKNIHPEYYYLYQVPDGPSVMVEPGTNTNIFYEEIFSPGEDSIRHKKKSAKKKFAKITLSQFFHNKEFHPCLGKSFAFTWRGDILPCIMMRNAPLGNIQEQALYSVFSCKGIHVMKYWHLNLDQFSRCKDCEFRYACSDCRAIGMLGSGDIMKRGICGYDPAEGKWA